MIHYADVIVLSKTVESDIYTDALLTKLSNVEKQVGIKGGVAREMLKVALGFVETHSPKKISDLDLAVFEDPMKTREKRIARRNHYTSLIDDVEPKDLEFLESGEKGLEHYFLTRDVTMNEVLVLKSGTDFVLLYTPECRNALKNRVIEPSVHCAHSGLGTVWVLKGGKPVIHPNIVRRCIYRRIKGDGDLYSLEPFSIQDSINLFDVDMLFKLSKRFMHDRTLFQKCCAALIEFGFDTDDIEIVVNMSEDFVKKPSENIDSEKVEDLLELAKKNYNNWRSEHQASYFHTTAKVIFT